MARTVTLQPQTVTLTNTASGTTVWDKKYDPTLSTTLVNGTAVTYGEGELNGATTATTNFIHNITDDLITKYK